MPAGHENVFNKVSVQNFHHQYARGCFFFKTLFWRRNCQNCFCNNHVFLRHEDFKADSGFPFPRFNANIPTINQPISSFKAPENQWGNKKTKVVLNEKMPKSKNITKWVLKKKRLKPCLYQIFPKIINSFATRVIEKISKRKSSLRLKSETTF